MLSHRAKPSILAGKMSATHMQVRHFWPFNKRHDWCSHLDPQFARYQRQRHINTRARLLKSIRRRNKWDLGVDNGMFFTPKHIRLASHYYGRGNRSRWLREVEQEDGKVENDGHQLTEKEKLWKEQMERMRNRIERDPYEAVFGRRVEPFWEGLMPDWMREELGLARKDAEPAKTVKSSENKTATPTYASSSHTSWDSWTNKVRKSEWNSSTGSKHYEYDPISNRMIEVSRPKSGGEPVQVKQTAPQPKPTQDGPRKAIPIPQFAEPVPNPALLTSTTNADVEGLTASNIRASMGKLKSQDHHQIAALLQESAPKKSASSTFDHAETYYMLEQQLQALQLQRDNLAKNSSRIHHIGLARRHQRLEGEILFLTKKLEALDAEQIEMANAETRSAPLQTALERGATTNITQKPLKPAMERMQTKPALTPFELDDSAAHESTEPITAVPKAWNMQAELLQADRVKRTAIKSTIPFPPSWVASTEVVPEQAVESAEPSASTKLLNAEVDRIVEAMDSHETPRAAREPQTSLPGEQTCKPQDSEKDMKEKIAELESTQIKHKAKIAALRNELDLAYKQSSRHADEFRDQVKQAEQRTDLSRALEQKYKAKITTLKEDLDTAFKQSSVQADELRDHIKKAEAQLAARIKADEHMSKIRIEHEANAAAAERLAKAEQQLQEMSRTIAEQEDAKRVLQERAETIARAQPTKSVHRKSLDERFARYKRVGQTSLSAAEEPDFHEVKHAYRFKPDDLEAELCGSKTADGKSTSNSAKTYRFKKDDLESELTGKSKSVQAPRPVNPIDGTTAPATGNYASPTGFVNFDPVVPIKSSHSGTDAADKTRIKRQEHVFSGTKRVHDRYERREFRHSYRRRRARFRRLVKFAAIVGGLGATIAYVQGTSMEQQDVRLQASQEVYKKMAEQYEKKGEQGLVEAVQENVRKGGGYFWK